MVNSSISGMVGGQQEASAINRTIEASNTGGSIISDYTAEELEELESRGLNPYWDRVKFLTELKNRRNKTVFFVLTKIKYLTTESELIELFLPENTEDGNQENDQRGNVRDDRPVNPEGNGENREELQGSEPGVQGEDEGEIRKKSGLTPTEKEIQSLEKEKVELIAEKANVTKRANERNGLFGDVKAQIVNYQGSSDLMVVTFTPYLNKSILIQTTSILL
jgi:hypothetical protein